MTMSQQEVIPAAQEEIDALDAEIARLRRELRAAESNRSEALCRPWGIEIGQLVRSTSKRDAGKLGKIASYDTPFTRTMRPWVQVKVQNKDGSFGNRVVNFYGDWERVEDAASDTA